ncbi:MAG: 2-C-methyl-D-erythritol 2,4-cyclodiphosphate synthase [Bacteroidales bacterium]
MSYRIGFGYDVHQLAEGRKLILGGIEIPSEKGCVAHSDGDVLIHAICDAILGAAALGDIGTHFPDTDPQYKDISSTILLEECLKKIKEKGFILINIDSTICLQKPKLSNYKEQISNSLKNLTGIEDVSVKATTTEKLGFVGEGKGVSAYSVVMLQKIQ